MFPSSRAISSKTACSYDHFCPTPMEYLRYIDEYLLSLFHLYCIDGYSYYTTLFYECQMRSKQDLRKFFVGSRSSQASPLVNFCVKRISNSLKTKHLLFGSIASFRGIKFQSKLHRDTSSKLPKIQSSRMFMAYSQIYYISHFTLNTLKLTIFKQA